MAIALLVGAALATVPSDAGGATISVHVDRSAISTRLGREFVFRSTVVNRGAHPANGLIAHLNVLSLRDGTYVDPEDWSSHRTRYLPGIPARGALRLTWRMQAVNAGRFGVYVAVLPDSGAAPAPITAPTIRVVVAERRTLSSGGVLPLVLAVPALLAGLALAVRARRHAA